MRPPVALALTLPLLALPAVGIPALSACGGSPFTVGSAPLDAAPAPTSTTDASIPHSFCAVEAGAHTFCDDFEGAPLSALWNGITQKGGASAISVDDAVSYSPPDSLHALTDVSNATATFQARVYKTFGAASHVVVAFDLRIDTVGAKPLAGSDSFTDIQIGTDYTLGFVAYQDNISYAEDLAPGDGGLAVSESSHFIAATSTIIHNWANVKLDVDIAGKTIAVSINGALDLPPAAITPPAGPITVYVGTRARNVASAVEGHYDNVTIDVTP